MPNASGDAINLIERLCSWDPCNRLTAAEALQHPFFQSCYYVPPSLRPKLSVGPRGSLELQQQQSVKRLPVAPTNNVNKPFNSYVTPKTNAPFGYGVNSYSTPKKNAPFDNGATQRKLDMANNNNQYKAWNNKPVRSNYVKDAKYRPPGRKSPRK